VLSSAVRCQVGESHFHLHSDRSDCANPDDAGTANLVDERALVELLAKACLGSGYTMYADVAYPASPQGTIFLASRLR
jgi:hypothetical protein